MLPGSLAILVTRRVIALDNFCVSAEAVVGLIIFCLRRPRERPAAIAASPGGPLLAVAAHLGRHYWSNAACLIQSHLFSFTALLV